MGGVMQDNQQQNQQLIKEDELSDNSHEQTVEQTVELTPESAKRVEEGIETFRAMESLSEKRRLKIEELRTENKMLQLEVDTLRLEVHDMKQRLHDADKTRETAVAHRVAYEALVQLVARQLGEFVPPTPPYQAPQRQKLISTANQPSVKKTQSDSQ